MRYVRVTAVAMLLDWWTVHNMSHDVHNMSWYAWSMWHIKISTCYASQMRLFSVFTYWHVVHKWMPILFQLPSLRQRLSDFLFFSFSCPSTLPTYYFSSFLVGPLTHSRLLPVAKPTGLWTQWLLLLLLLELKIVAWRGGLWTQRVVLVSSSRLSLFSVNVFQQSLFLFLVVKAERRAKSKGLLHSMYIL